MVATFFRKLSFVIVGSLLPALAAAQSAPGVTSDKILLDHAVRQPNVTLLQPASVERAAFDDEGVTATVSEAAGSRGRFGEMTM